MHINNSKNNKFSRLYHPPQRKKTKKNKQKEIPTQSEMSKPQSVVNGKRVITAKAASVGDAAADSRCWCWVWKHCPLLVIPTHRLSRGHRDAASSAMTASDDARWMSMASSSKSKETCWDGWSN